jgi:hypothetical protein
MKNIKKKLRAIWVISVAVYSILPVSAQAEDELDPFYKENHEYICIGLQYSEMCPVSL